LKGGVAEAHAAEGHVTVARLSSTTTSARHQVENRWNMLSKATRRHVGEEVKASLDLT
jgi:hypothetical protein